MTNLKGLVDFTSLFPSNVQSGYRICFYTIRSYILVIDRINVSFTNELCNMLIKSLSLAFPETLREPL